eukprot:949681-Rhodomonas_salina.2
MMNVRHCLNGDRICELISRQFLTEGRARSYVRLVVTGFRVLGMEPHAGEAWIALFDLENLPRHVPLLLECQSYASPEIGIA